MRSALEEGEVHRRHFEALGRGKHEANKEPVNPDRKAMHETLPKAAPPPSPSASTAPKADLAKSLAKLQTNLMSELQSGKVQAPLDERGLTISLREAAFFASGDAALLTAIEPADFGKDRGSGGRSAKFPAPRRPHRCAPD